MITIPTVIECDHCKVTTNHHANVVPGGADGWQVAKYMLETPRAPDGWSIVHLLTARYVTVCPDSMCREYAARAIEDSLKSYPMGGISKHQIDMVANIARALRV